MKTLNLNVNLEGVTLSEEERAMPAQKITTLVLDNMILSWAGQKQGLKEDERRKYYKIKDAFEKVLADGAKEVELEDDWFTMLKRAKTEGSMMPNILYRRVEELIEAVK